MSAPSPGSESAPENQVPPAAQPPRARASCNWHRVILYTLSIMVIGAIWFCALMSQVAFHPQRIVDRALARLPYPSSTGNVYWINRRTLKIEYLKIGNFFYADSVIVTASPFGLWRHHLAKVQVIGAQLFTKELAAALKGTPAPPATPRNGWSLQTLADTLSGRMTGVSGSGVDWVIGRLEISRGTLRLDNLVADASIPVGLGVAHPLVLTGLRLGKPDASPEMAVERTIDIRSVNITSPFDPLAPVFVFPLTRVTFSYAEIWRHHIARLDLIHPTMFLGEDLFWLTRELKAEKPTATKGVDAPWVVSEFKVDYGRLAVNAFGQPAVHLPFFIKTRVDDIRLDQLDRISAKSTVNIENLTQEYPDYKVRLVNLSGKLYFNWPPTNTTVDNVYNKVDIDEVSWNDIAATKVSTSVTFDPNGVYGRLNGACEGGQLSGNFEFYYSKGFTWNADFFADKVNCRPIAEKLVGKYADLTGDINGRLSVQGRATEILKCTGLLSLPNAGTLKIKSMKELLDRLPADTPALKRDALKLAINSLETYPYDTGRLTLNYTPAGGTSVLRLDGPRGARNFEVALHPYPDGGGSGR